MILLLGYIIEWHITVKHLNTEYLSLIAIKQSYQQFY